MFQSGVGCVVLSSVLEGAFFSGDTMEYTISSLRFIVAARRQREASESRVSCGERMNKGEKRVLEAAYSRNCQVRNPDSSVYYVTSDRDFHLRLTVTC